MRTVALEARMATQRALSGAVRIPDIGIALWAGERSVPKDGSHDGTATWPADGDGRERLAALLAPPMLAPYAVQLEGRT